MLEARYATRARSGRLRAALAVLPRCAPAALLADVERRIVQPGETVVFMHTGGDPLVSACADVLADAARFHCRRPDPATPTPA